MKYARGLSASLIFLAVFIATYVVHVKYFRVDVVFYSALFDGLVATLLTVLIVNACNWFKIFSAFEKVQLAVIWLLTAYALAISVPTVIDRSLSFYILEKLDQRGGGIRLDRFQEVFTREYLPEHRLIDVRLTEQQESGTIVIENGCVKLTEWGRTLSLISRTFRKNFLPQKRLLMGSYSDDLTDPFRNSVVGALDYTCD